MSPCSQGHTAARFVRGNGKHTECRTCKNEKQEIRRKQKRAKGDSKYYRQSRDGLLKWHYNISIEDYEEMLEEQDNRCAICKRDKNEFIRMLAVDHCHTTGKIRGLLCTNCNAGLGMFRDNRTSLVMAIRYLETSEEC